MPAAVNQDFVTYAGDMVAPIFTVVGSDGVTPISIAGVTEITWSVRRNLDDVASLSKTKSAGAITFVTDGTNGQFQVAIQNADTTALSGWYTHTASLTDAAGHVTTVAVGRMMVGQSPSWTWNPGSVGVEALYTVRQIIGDTVQSDQLLSDQQIKWAISQYSNEWLAAAECARDIAANQARMVDIVQGELKTNYSARSKRYSALAIDLEQRGFARGGVNGYAGGISLGDKLNQVSNTDRTPPQFVIGMFDNLLPESPVGHQTGAGQAMPNDWWTWDML